MYTFSLEEKYYPLANFKKLKISSSMLTSYFFSPKKALKWLRNMHGGLKSIAVKCIKIAPLKIRLPSMVPCMLSSRTQLMMS